ncbi:MULTISPECIES: hypothetical protein [Bradyrhizobium]|jgi:hypothetical protein|uniref:DUF680 domain-containing protein n=1 Tax=Bradyrhizobium ottawaense TaxID=931866 RepID=A0A2U8PAU3_9BRAD|nr:MULTISPECIES: hypothetical protein [Bradyrhizobium]AWL94640.1 hypothetical protein CIT37_22620 [Bradyrhizobium ottawaense]MBR1329395.1 hypothetical protein [Bradyrhizobium ottawaense]MBR1335634.1 hypothetical protein [Bradyrhizobium ottawaense]MDA9445584.1 hypothetical protein [Bradyrhizobium sp. CCBAU 21360]MDA9459171.1 hypothetical protein [Bradyrhizobium sp. CCBAU 21359]
MNMTITRCSLLLAGLLAVAAPPTVTLAQSKDDSAAMAKQIGTATSKKEAPPNTNTNPTKHRYWRHRGGRHPHYGSRRLRT